MALGYAIKLWWRFMQKENLWSKFLHLKYCRKKHPSVTTNMRNASIIWKRIITIREVAKPHIKWLIGEGDIDAYKDS